MVEPSFQIKYDGGDANRHQIDMRLFGMSLAGADRITSDALIVLVHGRLPKRGERAPVILKASEPRQGTVTVQGIHEAAANLLPLGAPIAADLMSGWLQSWWQILKAKFTGTESDNAVALRQMADLAKDLNRDHLAARDKSEERLAELLQLQWGMHQRPLEHFAAPIGPSVDLGLVSHGERPPIQIDRNDANAIRDAGKVEWGRLEEMQLRTDGFRFHTSALSIENPEGEGFLMARVRDPEFDEPENKYTNAANHRSEIIVMARRGYKDGDLVKIEIVEFVSEIPA